MARLKTSISLDEQLVANLDRQAEADGISRSELIERLCRRALEEEPKIECLKYFGPPSKLPAFISAIEWHDHDGPVEFVMRVPMAQWLESAERVRREIAGKQSQKEDSR